MTDIQTGEAWASRGMPAPRRTARQTLHAWTDKTFLLALARGHRYWLFMRICHRFHFCWMQPCGPANEMAWCHWCGMRGKR